VIIRARSFASAVMSLIRMHIPRVEGACREEGQRTGRGRRDDVGTMTTTIGVIVDVNLLPLIVMAKGGGGAPLLGCAGPRVVVNSCLHQHHRSVLRVDGGMVKPRILFPMYFAKRNCMNSCF
jgi:hypothetical protein